VERPQQGEAGYLHPPRREHHEWLVTADWKRARNPRSALTMHVNCHTICEALTNKGLIAMTTTLSIRMDEDLKAEAEEFFSDIGMNMTTAITCFFKKCLDVGEIPFKLGRKKTPREITLEAIEEAKRLERDPKTPRCSDPAKLREFLLS
jgi:DNA-damage-inducible protein J